jgi:hypothetical protein
VEPYRRILRISPKQWYLPASPLGITTQKTNIDIFTAVRSSDLQNECVLLSIDFVAKDTKNTDPLFIFGEFYTIILRL